MTIGRVMLLSAGLLLWAGCATSMTPEQRMAHEIFSDVAGECERRFHTIHVDYVDLDGGVKIHADADSRSEYRPFVACVDEGLKARVEARRKAGLPPIESLSRVPDVELD